MSPNPVFLWNTLLQLNPLPWQAESESCVQTELLCTPVVSSDRNNARSWSLCVLRCKNQVSVSAFLLRFVSGSVSGYGKTAIPGEPLWPPGKVQQVSSKPHPASVGPRSTAGGWGEGGCFFRALSLRWGLCLVSYRTDSHKMVGLFCVQTPDAFGQAWRGSHHAPKNR